MLPSCFPPLGGDLRWLRLLVGEHRYCTDCFVQGLSAPVRTMNCHGCVPVCTRARMCVLGWLHVTQDPWYSFG